MKIQGITSVWLDFNFSLLDLIWNPISIIPVKPMKVPYMDKH